LENLGAKLEKKGSQVGKFEGQVGKIELQVGIDIFQTKGVSITEKAFGDSQKQ